MIFDPAFHLLFFILNCFQFKNFKKRRFFVHTHTTFDVCVWTKYLKIMIFRKIFSAKNFLAMAEKNVRDFFSNFKIKIFFKILENIFWIFHFLKNNDFTF